MDLRKDKKKDALCTAVALAGMLVVLLVMELTMKSTSILFTVLKKGVIYALVAVSMNLLNGFTGLFSLGQAGFMLIGAYTYSILSMPISVKMGESVYKYYDCAIGIELGIFPSLILAFEAVKMVVIPLVIHYSNYHAYFDREYFDNMPAAVLLTVYECVAVFLVMAVLAARKRKSQENTQTNTQTEIKTYTTNEKWYRIILIALLVIAVIMIVIAPQSLGGYRTLIKLGDEEYTHLDVSDLIYTQSTGFINRFAMVMQRNILLVLRLVIPAVIIIALSKKRYTMLIALLVAATPFLIVDDTIGRSLYYSVILCYLVYYIYKPRYAKPLIAVAGVLAFAFLVVYWRIRYSASTRSNTSSSKLNDTSPLTPCAFPMRPIL